MFMEGDGYKEGRGGNVVGAGASKNIPFYGVVRRGLTVFYGKKQKQRRGGVEDREEEEEVGIGMEGEQSSCSCSLE